MHDGNTQYTGNPYVVCHRKNCIWQKFCLWVHSRRGKKIAEFPILVTVFIYIYININSDTQMYVTF